MKKLFAILLMLSLLFAVSAQAETGAADVTFKGKTYHITLDEIKIDRGRLRLVIGGMTDSMTITPSFDILYAATPVPYYGDEALYADDKNIAVGKDFTFTFDRDTYPDKIMLVPTEEDQKPILFWENAAGSAQGDIPEEMIGKWKGIGTPKNGGTPIDLEVVINADGSGEYTFIQGTYIESFPFSIQNDSSSFSVDIPATSMLGSVAGTWALTDGVLLLDITSTFTGGGSYSYTAECVKSE